MYDKDIGTYSDLRTYVQRWADGRLPFVVIVGPPGVGKTEAAKRALLGKKYLSVRGKESPLNFYITLYQHCPELTLIDDVEGLFSTRDGKALIRDFTETIGIKTVGWGTWTKELTALGIPTSFQTASRTLILANTWGTSGIYGAIASRAMVVRFKPSWTEVYREAGTWFRDQEVLDFVHRHLGRLRDPDLRRLLKARDLRRAGFSKDHWMAIFDSCLVGSSARTTVIELLSDPSFRTNTERMDEFVRRGAGDRSTFYRLMRRIVDLTKEAAVERIVVRPSVTEVVAKPADPPGSVGDKDLGPNPTAAEPAEVIRCF